MINCCSSKWLGVFPHNTNNIFSIKATQAGLHVLQVWFNGTVRTIHMTCGIGDNIYISSNVPLNESFVYELRIIQPDGTAYTMDGFCCFKFQIVIGKTAADLSYEYTKGLEWDYNLDVDCGYSENPCVDRPCFGSIITDTRDILFWDGNEMIKVGDKIYNDSELTDLYIHGDFCWMKAILCTGEIIEPTPHINTRINIQPPESGIISSLTDCSPK